ncbi:MAG: MFS transporter [Firmicutes bacterium]|nr:MFS transporter [Bacillota bacterium]
MDINSLTDLQKKEEIKKTRSKAAVSLAAPILAYIVFVFIRTSGGVVASQATQELGWGPEQVAMFTSIFSYVYSFANLPGGMLVDRFGGKKLIATSYSIMAVGLAILAFSDSYPLMILSRALMGFGGAVVFSALSRLIANWTKADQYASVNSKVMAASKIGTFFAATPLVLMLRAWGRRQSMVYFAIVVVVITVAIFLLTKEDPESCGLYTVDELEGRAHPAPKKAENPFKGIGKIIAQPQVWLVLIGSISFNGAINTFITNWGKTMLSQGAGFESVEATGIINVNTIAGIISGLLLGTLMRIKGATPKVMTLLSFVLFLTGMGMVAFAMPSLGKLGWDIVFALIGFGSSIEVTTIYAMLKDQVTVKNFGKVVGLCNFAAWLLGTSVCTTVWGKIVDAQFSIPSFQKAATFQFCFSVLGFICCILAKAELLPAFKDEA